MTTRPTPQCITCAHWISPLEVGDGTGDTQTCAAFPKAIPDEIWWNRFDHRQPHDGDHGIQWTPDGDSEFPDWAMNN